MKQKQNVPQKTGGFAKDVSWNKNLIYQLVKVLQHKNLK